MADQAITLVRDEQELLPISPKKYKRVYLNVIQKDLDPENALCSHGKRSLSRKASKVTVRDRRVSILWKIS